MPVEGENSPEYLAVKRNCDILVSLLDNPTNNSGASKRLFEADMIESASTDISGKDMVNSVLHCIRGNAAKYYRFLAILQTLNLSNNRDILKNLCEIFRCKNLAILCMHGLKNFVIIIIDNIQQKIPRDAYQECSIDQRKCTSQEHVG